MKFNLMVWRQEGPDKPGRMESFTVTDILPEMSILETLDALNETLIKQGKRPVEFDSDCREGICGMCGQVVNGIPHGSQKKTTVCQLHMRHFKDGDTIYIEPFRARAFPAAEHTYPMADEDAEVRVVLEIRLQCVVAERDVVGDARAIRCHDRQDDAAVGHGPHLHAALVAQGHDVDHLTVGHLAERHHRHAGRRIHRGRGLARRTAPGGGERKQCGKRERGHAEGRSHAAHGITILTTTQSRVQE